MRKDRQRSDSKAGRKPHRNAGELDSGGHSAGIGASAQEILEVLLKQHPDKAPALKTVEVQRLLGELVVRQEKLQRHNEELCRAQELPAFPRDAYAEFFDLAPVGGLIVDADGRILDANRSAAAMLDTASTQLKGRAFADFVLRDFPAEWNELCQGNAGRDLSLRRGGGPFIAHVECTPRPETNRFLITLTEPPHPHKADAPPPAAAAESWQTTFDAMADAVFILDENQRILHANRAAASIFDCPAEAMRGRSCWQITHSSMGAQGPIQECPVRRMLTSGRRESMELARGGSVFLVTADPLKNAAGKVYGAVHIVRDITASKQAEEKLRRSEERLRTAAAAGQFGTFEADLVSGDVYWSPEMRKILGMADDVPAKHDPHTAPPFIHPDDADEVSAQLRRAHDPSGSGAVEHEHRIVRPGGTVRWMLLKAQVTFAGEGPHRRPARWNGVVLDVTKRKEAELAQRKSELELAVLNLQLEQRVAARTAELQESEQRFRTLFEDAPDAGFLIDLNGRLLDGNKAAERMIGHQLEELLGENMLEADLLPPASREIAAANLARLAQGERVEATELVLLHKNGSEIPAEITTMPIQLQGRTIVLGSARDLTYRTLTEKTLRESEERFRTIFDQIPDGILMADPETRKFHMASQAFCSKIGYSEEQVLKMGPAGLHTAEHLPYVMDAFDKNLRGETEEAYDIPFLRSSGDIFYADLKSFPILLDGKRYVLGHIHDISERKRMQEALEKRIVALTQPLDRPEGITFEALFDLQELQRLQDDFSAAACAASIITAPDGTPITKPSNFTALCSQLIRQTEKGCANCIKSDAVIGRHHPQGPIVMQCGSGGLWEAGAGIVVGGRHIANWLIGQVRSDAQTEEQIRAYAREIEADEEAMAEEFRQVPVMSREQFEKIAQALFTLAEQISTSAYQNVQQARFITARKTAEQALRESEQKYRLIFESESDAIMIFDAETRQFVDINRAAEQMYGYTREEFLQLRQPAISAEPEDSDAAIRATLAGELSSVPLRLHRKKDGTVFPIELTGCTFAWKGRQVICAVIRDITERTAHENELRRLHAELSQAEQRERERIAKELHDGVSQMLSSSCLRLNILKEQELPEAAAESITTVCGILQETLQQTRSLTFELSCPMLNELGLAAALEELCSSMTHEQSIQFEFNSTGESLPLDMDRQIILYRSTRELLVNVMKHSEAERAGVTLTCEGANARICVKDDGKGFDAALAGKGFSQTGGYGLFSIREYLRHTGGNLQIESVPGGGAEVVLTVPLKENNE